MVPVLIAGCHHHFGTKNVHWVILWVPIGIWHPKMMIARILILVSIASQIFAKPTSRIVLLVMGYQMVAGQ
jgi:hypothetical protein